MIVLKHIISPGDLVAELSGLDAGGESRQVPRMLVNALIWGAVGVAAFAA